MKTDVRVARPRPGDATPRWPGVASDEDHGAVVGVDDLPRDAAEQRALEPRMPALAHDDRAGVELLRRARDDLRGRAVGDEQERLGVEAGLARDRRAVGDDVLGVRSRAHGGVDATAITPWMPPNDISVGL